MLQSQLDLWHMRHALAIAARGQGWVEPNPMVGCVIARGAEIVAQGFHRRFGGPHAEVEALAVAGPRARGATAYVTLEPCCHHGKTPPCTEALIAAGLKRVVVALRDPFPAVAGKGLQRLSSAGIETDVGVCEDEARRQNAPYLCLVEQGRPWIIAKWAMTLDGKLATRTGNSQWISNDAARAVVHKLRGRVDAIVVGRGTVEADDPLLTARPAGARVALRVVLSSEGVLPERSRLLRSLDTAPLLVVAQVAAPAANVERLRQAGCEVFLVPRGTPAARLSALFEELARRRLTNVFVEGGNRLFGALADARLIDEIHAFIAPIIVGGAAAPSPVGGEGAGQIAEAMRLDQPSVEILRDNVYVRGQVARTDE